MDNRGVEENLLELHGDNTKRDFRREVLFRFIKPHLPVFGRCADVGCGSGYMVERIGELGLDILGIDSSQILVSLSEKRLSEWKNVRFFVSGIQNLPSFGQFDTLVCLDVIEHLEDDFSALLRLHEACKLGGKLILSVPAMPRLYGKRDVLLGHYRRYSKRELEEKLKAAGFTVKTCQYWNLIGAPIYWFSECILKRSIDDSLRTGSDSSLKKLVRSLLERWLSCEMKCRFLPFGLSLLTVSMKSI